MDANRLLSHQRAELGAAEIMRGWSLAFQFVAAFFAAISVFSNNGKVLLWIATLTIVVLAVWGITDFYYSRHRAAGDQARRLLLVTNGLGERVHDLNQIATCFTARPKEGEEASISDYFGSRAEPGTRRLAEMLEESAFFTSALQRASGELMMIFLIGSTILAASGWLATSPALNDANMIAIARVFLAFTVFFLSSDVLGAALAHNRAAVAMSAMRLRLAAARARGFPNGDILQAVADYNAAVEGAPLPLPRLYKRRALELNRAWAEYKEDMGIGHG